MSASHKFKIAKLVAGSSLEDKWSVWSAPSPKVEAQALLKLVRFNGSTVETIRELIDIPAETEEYFRSFVADHPEEESPIERVIEFRKRVREEFDRLVSELELPLNYELKLCRVAGALRGLTSTRLPQSSRNPRFFAPVRESRALCR